MSTRLYVGNLPSRLCFPELEDLFTPFGSIATAELITDPATGWSRGFGFVEMTNNEDAQAAITALNGHEVEGNNLVVNEASLMRGGPRDRGSRSGGGDSGRSSGGPPRSRVEPVCLSATCPTAPALQTLRRCSKKPAPWPVSVW